MFTFLISLTIVVAVLLILVVLSQNAKGGGLSSQFGGSGSSNQMIGVKRTTDLLEKLTWGFAIALILLTLSSSFLIETQTAENVIGSPNIDRAQERTVLPNMNTDVPSEEGGADTSEVFDLEELGEPDEAPQQ